MNRQGVCVAFGSFEFMHKGHIEVAKKVVELSREQGLQPIIVSHPADGDVYTTEKEKEYLLKGIGIDRLITSAKTVHDLIKELGVKVLVVGENHPELTELEDLARKVDVQMAIVPTVCYDGKPITYDWLEEVFEANDFDLLTKLCDHPYILIGDVVHGKKLGRTVGMPTTNLHIYKTKKRPNCGVYATKFIIDDESYKAATNIGKRPTVDDFDYVTIETFILDFDKQIYGEICVLEIHEFLREVKKFDSLEEVRLQVEKDIDQIRKKFREV